MPRLLIVPGTYDLLRSLPEALNGAAEVVVLEGANDALWEVRQNPPDALVVGMDVAGMSGLELAELIPNFDVATRVILVSADADDPAAPQAAAAGVFRFVSAPQTTAVLREVVVAAFAAAPAPAPEPAPVAPTVPAEPQLSRAERLAQRLAEPIPARQEPEPPAPRHDRLAQRMAQAASQRPAPAARPVEPAPPPPEPARRGRRSGSLVLTAESLAPMRSRIGELHQETGAQCILLTDRNGMVLTQIGDPGNIPTMVLLPLLSTAFSAAGQISQLLREKDSDALYMQEGSHFDLYCFDIDKTYMLVILFNKNVLASKIGTVWVYTKRAIKDLQEQLR
jgi:FixJ family two-component response regulator